MLFLAIAMMTGTVNGIAAPRSGVFNGNQYGEVTPPNSSTFTNMGAHTIEFRIHGLSATRPADQIIFYTDDTSCVLQANSTVMRCRTWRGTSHFVDLSLGTSTDIRARVQYDPAATRFSAEIWNGDGSGYKISQFSAPLLASYNATRPLSIGGLASVGRLTGSIAFFRWTAGLVGLNGPPPPDIAATPASLFDYGFENNLTDASPTGRNLLMNGSGFGYQDSPTYLPASVVSSPLANRAAFETQLDGRRSFSSVGTGNMTRYQWQQVGGPYPAEIQKPNSALTAVIMPVAGTYTFRLEVTDELGQTAASEIRVGAVATDDNNIVFIDKPDIAFLLGTMTQSGTSPWPWYDQTEIRVADQLGLALPPSPGETPATGNISVSAGSPTINGSGTAFRTLFACNGSDLIVIRYPVPGGGTGRRAYTVTACASDQQLTIAPAYDASANATLVQYAKMTQVEQAAWSGGGNNWNYYDAVAAFYRLYY
ncbi:MAG: PKD domain-containing protein, partial [Acidobacteriota bacterium]